MDQLSLRAGCKPAFVGLADTRTPEGHRDNVAAHASVCRTRRANQIKRVQCGMDSGSLLKLLI